MASLSCEPAKARRDLASVLSPPERVLAKLCSFSPSSTHTSL